MVRIRKAEVKDISDLLPLVAAYWEFESIAGFEAEGVGRQLERLLTAPRLGAGWIASVDERPVGYLLAVYVFSLEHMGITAEIDELFVSSSERYAAVGSTLLSVAEAECAEIGCTKVSLQLSRRNDAARGFYINRGYTTRSGYELMDKTLRSG